MLEIIIFGIIALTFCKEIDDVKLEHTLTCQDPSHKHYPLINLGYITPWNRKGYDIVKKYAKKFDIISPTWFELESEKFRDEFNVLIDGANNIDMQLLNDLREANQKVQILPRFHCNSFTLDKMNEFLTEKAINKFSRILLRRLKHNKFDGIILDCIQIWINNDVTNKFKAILPLLSANLKKENMKFIITAFPLTEGSSITNSLTKENFKEFAEYIDYFNIMTYDYMQYHREEINKDSVYNAPIEWVKKSIAQYLDEGDKNRKKVLMGVPFHGFVFDEHYTGKEVLNSKKFNDFIQTVKEKDSLHWDEEASEHYLNVDNKGKIYAVYPTRKFINKRLELSKQLNLGGIGIWDVGNGNEGFMDEF